VGPVIPERKSLRLMGDHKTAQEKAEENIQMKNLESNYTKKKGTYAKTPHIPLPNVDDAENIAYCLNIDIGSDLSLSNNYEENKESRVSLPPSGEGHYGPDSGFGGSGPLLEIPKPVVLMKDKDTKRGKHPMKMMSK